MQPQRAQSYTEFLIENEELSLCVTQSTLRFKSKVFMPFY